jgi:hypothetical protein
MMGSGARGGVIIRATRAMPTVPDASAMDGATAATASVDGITPIGIVTATALAARSNPQSAGANASASALPIATVSSGAPSSATMATATPPKRLVRTPPAE